MQHKHQLVLVDAHEERLSIVAARCILLRCNIVTEAIGITLPMRPDAEQRIWLCRVALQILLGPLCLVSLHAVCLPAPHASDLMCAKQFGLCFAEWHFTSFLDRYVCIHSMLFARRNPCF